LPSPLNYVRPNSLSAGSLPENEILQPHAPFHCARGCLKTQIVNAEKSDFRIIPAVSTGYQKSDRHEIQKNFAFLTIWFFAPRVPQRKSPLAAAEALSPHARTSSKRTPAARFPTVHRLSLPHLRPHPRPRQSPALLHPQGSTPPPRHGVLIANGQKISFSSNRGRINWISKL
jgi:hypothetical protein